jgi:hypothetical protein
MEAGGGQQIRVSPFDIPSSPFVIPDIRHRESLVRRRQVGSEMLRLHLLPLTKWDGGGFFDQECAEVSF